MKECKRCLLRESAENDTFELIRSKVDALSETEKADDELYRKRLDACRDCDHLISGICMKCGCYVEFRAAFKKMKCPNPGDRKW
ncbi:MAG: hypothetical protein IJX93_01665 [Clostridia bacterium]|nr:hypothetical protein [Clostridia bacterium]MBQ8369537.1 hypothetical protein [Clostridia bacterium]